MAKKREISDLTPEKLTELEGDWRAGVMSIRVIAAKYGLETSTLRSYAQRVGWEGGDLRASIDQATTASLMSRAVGNQSGNATETVKKYGEFVANVVEEQRTEIGRARRLAGKYLAELEAFDVDAAVNESVSLVAQLISADNPDLAKALEQGRRELDRVDRLKLLGHRVAITRELSIATKNFVELERQAFGLDKPQGATAGYDEYLDEVLDEKNRDKE